MSDLRRKDLSSPHKAVIPSTSLGQFYCDVCRQVRSTAGRKRRRFGGFACALCLAGKGKT